MNIEEIYARYLSSPQVSTDTRTIGPGCIYIALKGDNFNGNTFAGKALDQGAAFVIVDEKIEDPRTGQIIQVADGLECLQALARYHRSQLHIPFLGITGSNGKTTTKELVHAVLAQQYTVYATRGNLNNHIGVPLSVLGVQADTEFAIIEMGANHPHEIEFLCTICQPDSGLITNVGRAHLEGFGGFEGVKKSKKELYDYLQAHNGRAFIQSGSSDLEKMGAGLKQVVRYGIRMSDDVQGEVLEGDPYLKISFKKKGLHDSTTVQTRLTGIYNFENILAAVSVGEVFGLEPQQIKAGLEGYIPANNRSQLQKTERNELVLDLYNANPSSMQAAISNFSQLSAPRKMLVLGDMFELGEAEKAEHQLVMEQLGQTGIKNLVLVGPVFSALKDLLPFANYFDSVTEAGLWFQAEKPSAYLILLKGSRGMHLEKLVELL